jgi:hypothetical protein
MLGRSESRVKSLYGSVLSRALLHLFPYGNNHQYATKPRNTSIVDLSITPKLDPQTSKTILR